MTLHKEHHSSVYATTLCNKCGIVWKIGSISNMCILNRHQLYLHRNPPEPHQASSQETSGTSPGICAKTPPEPCKVSAPEPSGTSQGICPEPSAPEPSGTARNPPELHGTLRNLTGYLHRNPLHRNRTRYLHRNPPEPCPEPAEAASPDRTGANLG